MLTYLYRFWGVFSVDATSLETAKKSFAIIAKIGGVELNDCAARSWLGDLKNPWLLIIDNVNDPEMNIADLFPVGERGFILINTQVPQNTKHGTVGKKSFVIDELEEQAATQLLLKAARIKTPWDKKTEDGANMICKSLGYLPLALIHAGSAIAARLCKLEGYLDLFEWIWKDQRAKNRWHPDSDEYEDSETYLQVYASYEILYSKLESKASGERTSHISDALDLLKIFSFFNHESIRIDLLSTAAKNSLPSPLRQDDRRKTWIQLSQSTLKEVVFALRINYRSQPVLPQMLRNVVDESINLYEFEARLQGAMNVLKQYSLITYHDETDSYSMHRLVHLWARMRPQMSLGDQAVWAQVAMNTIINSISIPLAGIPSKEDLVFHRSLLPHIMNIRKRQSEIRDLIQENQRRFRRIVPVVVPKSDLEVVDRDQAVQCIKLSYVYTICGKWDEALVLQQAVWQRWIGLGDLL